MSDVKSPFCSMDNATCELTVDIPFHVENGDSADDYTFEVHLDLNADGTVDEDLVVQDVLTDTYPDYLINYTLPFGQHEMLVDMVDWAGKSYSGTIAVHVLDCRAPAPICINSLSVELHPYFYTYVYPTDLIAASITDCSMPIVYSINRVGEVANIDQSYITLTCDDVGALQVEIHAWDSASNPLAPQPDGSTGGPNHDYCETVILGQDNTVDCN